MNLEVIILRGLPGSGKSTWARDHMNTHAGFVRVNRDDLRAMLHTHWSETNETVTVRIRNTVMITALLHGQSVIVDDTNLTAHAVEEIHRIIASLYRDITVREVWMNTDIDECIRRDALRPTGQCVGEQVIREMNAKIPEL